MISDELKMIGSLILAFCDDIIDEKNELEELKYIDDRVKRIVAGAILDFRKKAEHSQYRDKLSYIALSLLLEADDRPKSLSQCIDYIVKTDL
jgi:hypothetical protein